jgi:hypothetical protein
MDLSRFCLVPPGAGYTTRGSLGITRGCIPVFLDDHIEHPFCEYFASLGVGCDTFSLRVPEAELPRIPEILANVSFEREHMMRGALLAMRRHFIWNESDPDDAFHTTMRALRHVAMPAGGEKENVTLL